MGSTEFFQKIPKTYNPRIDVECDGDAQIVQKILKIHSQDLSTKFDLNSNSLAALPFLCYMVIIRCSFSRAGSEMTLSARFARADFFFLKKCFK